MNRSVPCLLACLMALAVLPSAVVAQDVPVNPDADCGEPTTGFTSGGVEVDSPVDGGQVVCVNYPDTSALPSAFCQDGQEFGADPCLPPSCDPTNGGDAETCSADLGADGLPTDPDGLCDTAVGDGVHDTFPDCIQPPAGLPEVPPACGPDETPSPDNVCIPGPAVPGMPPSCEEGQDPVDDQCLPASCDPTLGTPDECLADLGIPAPPGVGFCGAGEDPTNGDLCVPDPTAFDPCDPSGPLYDILSDPPQGPAFCDPTPPDENPTLVSMKVYSHGVRSKEAVALHGVVDFVIVASDDLNFTNVRLEEGTTVLASNTTGAAKSKTVTFVIATKTMVEGQHEFKAVVTDASGKEASLIRQLRVDNTPPAKPTITLGSDPTGTNGWYIHNVQVALASAGDAQGATSLSYTLNGRAAHNYTGAFALGGLGLTNFTAIATDEAGNRATTSQNIKLDTADPTVTFLARPVAAAAGSNVTIRMNVSSGAPPASVQVVLGGATHAATREGTTSVYALVHTLLASEAGRNLDYKAVAKDEAGREGSSETIKLAVGTGTTSVDADTDGDGLSDKEEATLGTNPSDINSPSFKATVPKVERMASNGTMKLTWTAPLQAKIDSFLVFRFSDPVKIGEVAFKPGQATYTFYDEKFPGGTHTYAVQTKLATDPLTSFTVAKASPNSAPITAAPASGATTLVQPKVVDALQEPWVYIGMALLLGIVVVMVTGIVRRRTPAQAPDLPPSE